METTTLLEKIKSVLKDGDTKLDIYERIVSKYPEFLEYKTNCYNSEKKAIQQIKAEIGSRLFTKREVIFNIDKSEKPHRYSLVDNNIVDVPLDDSVDIGYIYILDTNLYNKEGRSIYKIGKTIDLDRRIYQLDHEQGCYENHVLRYSYRVERPYKVERGIHCILDKGRVNPKREGFYSDYVEVHMELIESIIEIFKI